MRKFYFFLILFFYINKIYSIQLIKSSSILINKSFNNKNLFYSNNNNNSNNNNINKLLNISGGKLFNNIQQIKNNLLSNHKNSSLTSSSSLSSPSSSTSTSIPTLPTLSSSSISSSLSTSSTSKSNISNEFLPIQHSLTKQQQVYFFLSSIFLTCLFLSDIISVKIFSIKFIIPFIKKNIIINHTCGMLTFPITFLLGDIINEYYGEYATKFLVYIGLIMSLFIYFIIELSISLPFLNVIYNVTPTNFNSIFGNAKIMYLASILAYLIGQLIDINLFKFLKKLTKNKFLWLRATGSTIISQLIDSFIVTYLSFSLGKVLMNETPASKYEIISMALNGYILKFCIATLLTPFLYLLRYILEKYYDLLPLE